MGGGSDLTLAAPFPDDPVDPVDPLMNSKIDVFIVRVVSLGQNGALALCFFDFFEDVSHKTPTFGTQITKSSRTGSRKLTRKRRNPDFARILRVAEQKHEEMNLW